MTSTASITGLITGAETGLADAAADIAGPGAKPLLGARLVVAGAATVPSSKARSTREVSYGGRPEGYDRPADAGVPGRIASLWYGQPDSAAFGTRRAGRGLGWFNLVRARGLVVPRHRGTTRHLCSLYPAQTEPGLGHEGIFLGVDELTGGAAFHFDPFWMYSRNQIENPNMLVMGDVGFGKSSFVKCFIYRSIGAFGAPGPAGSPTEGGRWVAVVDPKGEYRPLADALGLQTIRLYPGGPDRVNPLDVGPSDGDRPGELALRRTTMVNALLSVLMKRSLNPVEEAGVAAAIAVLDPARDAEPTLGDVHRLLAHPTAEMATEAELGSQRLAEGCSTVRLGLGRLLSRDLRGMFDGRSTVKIDWASRGLVLDVSFVQQDPDAMAVVMIPATAWLQALMADARRSSPRKLQVIEECWALLRHEKVAFYLQRCWKLSRQYGAANLAVVHRLSDLRSQTDDGTAAAKVAMGLLADTQTRVCFRQPHGQIAEAVELLGLSARAAELLPKLPKGVSLWKVGTHDAIVGHRIGPSEWPICHTDAHLNVI
jgi:hypothetical protein